MTDLDAKRRCHIAIMGMTGEFTVEDVALAAEAPESVVWDALADEEDAGQVIVLEGAKFRVNRDLTQPPAEN